MNSVHHNLKKMAHSHTATLARTWITGLIHPVGAQAINLSI